jgi:hypothetical protein
MMQQEPSWLMVRFQSNCIFKIYKGAMQRKNMNMDKKIYRRVPWKIVINKFMTTRYRLQSIYYVYFVRK